MVKLINKLKNKKGFTLIELIVVLAVLAVIMAIAVPRFIGVQESAKIDADYSTGALIAKSAELYYAQNPTASDMSVGDADDKLGKDLSDVKFQSSKIKGQGLDTVKVDYNSSTGAIIVEVKQGTTTTMHVLYPRPATQSLE